MKRLLGALLVICNLLGGAGIVLTVGSMMTLESCTKAPPSLSPTGQREFYATRVIKVLDIVRDFAIDGEAAGVVSTDDARTVVLWHKSAVQVAQVSGANWQTIVATTLDEAVTHLKPELKAKIAPYVGLVKAVLQEVP